MVQVDFNCARCSASLAGLTLKDRCRECNLPLRYLLDMSLVDEETSVINSDVSCRKCKYNLRGLPVGSVCPECGTSAYSVIRGDPLSLASRDWLIKMKRAVLWMLGSMLSVLTLIPFALLCKENNRPYLFYLLLLSAYAVYLIAVFLLTGGKPNGLVKELSFGSRLSARIFAVFMSLSLFNILFMDRINLFFLVTIVFLPISFILAFRQVKLVASLCKNGAIAKRASRVITRLSWATGSMILPFFILLLRELFSWSIGYVMAIADFGVSVFVFAGYIIGYLSSLVLLSEVMDALGDAIGHQEEHPELVL